MYIANTLGPKVYLNFTCFGLLKAPRSELAPGGFLVLEGGPGGAV